MGDSSIPPWVKRASQWARDLRAVAVARAIVGLLVTAIATGAAGCAFMLPLTPAGPLLARLADQIGADGTAWPWTAPGWPLLEATSWLIGDDATGIVFGLLAGVTILVAQLRCGDIERLFAAVYGVPNP